MFLLVVLYHFDAYVLEIFKVQKCGMKYLWVNFLVQRFLWVLIFVNI